MTLAPRLGCLLCLVAVFSSCSKDLSQGEAADAIRTHLESVVPAGLKIYESVKVQVKEILIPGEYDREVRFELQSLTKPDKRQVVFEGLQMTLRRSDKGLLVVKYGERTKKEITTLWYAQRYSEYQELADLVVTAGPEVLKTSVADVQEIARRNGITIPKGVEWSLYRKPGFAAVFVVKGSDGAKCATYSEGIPPVADFHWLFRKDRLLTCIGRRGTFQLTDLDQVATIIDRNGGVLPAYNVSLE
jgi:hypothetical protein